MAAIPAGKCGNITCADGYSLLPVTGQLEWAGPVCRPRASPADAGDEYSSAGVGGAGVEAQADACCRLCSDGA